MPNLSDRVKLVVATMWVTDPFELSSSDSEDSPGEPGLRVFFSFFTLVSKTGLPFSLLEEGFLTCLGGGFTPVTSMTSPVLPRGLGGGG